MVKVTKIGVKSSLTLKANISQRMGRPKIHNLAQNLFFSEDFNGIRNCGVNLETSPRAPCFERSWSYENAIGRVNSIPRSKAHCEFDWRFATRSSKTWRLFSVNTIVLQSFVFKLLIWGFDTDCLWYMLEKYADFVTWSHLVRKTKRVDVIATHVRMYFCLQQLLKKELHR